MMSAVTLKHVMKNATHGAFISFFLISFPVEHVKAEAAQATIKMQEEFQQKNERLLQQKEKSHEELVKKLTEMVEKEQIQMRERQQRNEQLLQQKEKSYEERTKQLTEKVEKREAQVREMQQKNEQLLQQKEDSNKQAMKMINDKIRYLNYTTFNFFYLTII